MTKEMLDKLIEQERWETFDSINPDYHRDLLKALTELRDLQESCEDCISKTNALRVAKNEYLRGWHEALCKALNEKHSIHCEEGNFSVIQEETITGLGLSMDCAVGKDVENYMSTIPPVTPTRKKGKWKEYPHEWGDNWQYSDYECSICHNRSHFDTDYCPNCGAEMEAADEN